jgi:ABC-type nitrate/sulfonate/bicarbonate transport system permease component
VLIFGDPFDTGKDAVIVTVSRTSWPSGREHPVGIYTIRADGTTWTPVVDSSRNLLIGACTGFAAAVIATIAVLRRPPWPEMTEPVMIALAQTRDPQK